jgi:hypothetical protein
MAGNRPFGARRRRGRTVPFGMAALNADQLELLQRTRDGLPMWGGSVATNRLRREVDLLFALRLVEPDGRRPYRLSALGAAVLHAAKCDGRDPPGSA